MEAAALYAFARAAGVRVLCLAHVTNTMGLAGDDFEKGEADGTRDALAVIETVIAALRPSLWGGPGRVTRASSAPQFLSERDAERERCVMAAVRIIELCQAHHCVPG